MKTAGESFRRVVASAMRLEATEEVNLSGTKDCCWTSLWRVSIFVGSAHPLLRVCRAAFIGRRRSKPWNAASCGPWWNSQVQGTEWHGRATGSFRYRCFMVCRENWM